jgi:hypothetical protein
MTDMVQVAVAGDVTEAEEIQGILRSAGIDAEIGDGEDDSVTISVPEDSVEEAQDAIEAMTEPGDVIGEPSVGSRLTMCMVFLRGRPTATTSRPRPALPPQ